MQQHFQIDNGGQQKVPYRRLCIKGLICGHFRKRKKKSKQPEALRKAQEEVKKTKRKVAATSTKNENAKKQNQAIHDANFTAGQHTTGGKGFYVSRFSYMTYKTGFETN